MKRKRVGWAVLITLALVATGEDKWFSSGAFLAQAAEPQGRKRKKAK